MNLCSGIRVLSVDWQCLSEEILNLKFSRFSCCTWLCVLQVPNASLGTGEKLTSYSESPILCETSSFLSIFPPRNSFFKLLNILKLFKCSSWNIQGHCWTVSTRFSIWTCLVLPLAPALASQRELGNTEF